MPPSSGRHGELLRQVAASSTSGFTHAFAVGSPIAPTLKPSLSVPATSIATGRRHHGRTGAFGTRSEQRTCPCLLCFARLLKPDLCSRDSRKAGSRSLPL